MSRELIGDDLADGLRYPAGKLTKEVPLLRVRNYLDRMLRRFLPPLAKFRSHKRFRSLFEVSDLGQYRASYSLPNSVFDEDSRAW